MARWIYRMLQGSQTGTTQPRKKELQIYIIERERFMLISTQVSKIQAIYGIIVLKWLEMCWNVLKPTDYVYKSTSSTAQGGGGSFKNRKPIGEVGCCESGMAERSHWWTERCLRSPLFRSPSLTIYLPTHLSIFYVSIHRSIYLSLSHLITYLITYPSIYLSIYLSLSLSSLPFICLSVYLSSCRPVYLSIYRSIYLSVYLSICGAVSFSVL